MTKSFASIPSKIVPFFYSSFEYTETLDYTLEIKQSSSPEKEGMSSYFLTLFKK